jgi:starch synthase (maltosyl-transferring)
MLPMGYEFAFSKAMHVVNSTPDDWASEATNPRIDLRSFVAAVNYIKQETPALNVEGMQMRITDSQAPILGLVRFDATSGGLAQSFTLVLINADPYRAYSVDPGFLTAEAGISSGGFTELTPDQKPGPFEAGRAVQVEPLQLRVYSAGTSPRR